jgi:hypothetical protein
MNTDYRDRFERTLKRLFAETYNLIFVQAALEALQNRRSGVIVTTAFSALYSDRLLRLVRIFENSGDTATFWYLHRCEPNNVAQDIDIPHLAEFSDKVKHIRDKTFVHIDKDFVFDPDAAYRQVNLTGDEVIWAIESTWCTLKRLLDQRTGSPTSMGRMTLDGAREICLRDLSDMLKKGTVNELK